MRPPPEPDDPDEEREARLRPCRPAPDYSRPCRVTTNPTHHQLKVRNLQGQVMRSARALAARSWGRYDWQVSDCLRQLRDDVDALRRGEAEAEVRSACDGEGLARNP
jgi:hypothetical protein